MSASEQPSEHDVLVVRLHDTYFVVLARDVAALHTVGREVAPARALDVVLGGTGATGDAQARLLRVPSDSGDVLFETRASLELSRLPHSAFFALPRVVASARCGSWICGVVLLEQEAGRVLAVWIDLRALAAVATPDG